jgi:PAS domain S-box-containing protein
MTELPPEAEQDRLSWAAMGAKSNLTIPLFDTKGVQYLLAIHSIHKERDWPQEFVPRLKLLGEIFINAIEHRNKDQALRESEDRLSMALNAAGAGVWSMDIQSKQVWASESERELFGFSADEHITFDSFMRVIHPDDRESVRTAVEKTLRTKTPLFVEYRITRPDGSVCWIAARGCPHYNAKAEPDRLMGVSVNITERKRAEKKLFESRDTLRAFASRLMTIQEEERRRLARELHDDFTQRLAVLVMDMSKLEISAKAASTKFVPKLKQIREQIVELCTDIHDISRQLHPSIIDDLGLGRAIESECVNFTKHTGIVINYKPINVPLKISRDISVDLFRITQEALRNIQKYAHVKNADVCLVGGDNNITLTIHDSGIGFDTDRVRQSHSLGLFSMEERAQLIQGVFSMDSAPGRGTLIKVVVPLKGIESE